MRIGDHDLLQLTETEIEEKLIKVAKITLHPNYGNKYAVYLSIFDIPESKFQIQIKSKPEESFFVQS